MPERQAGLVLYDYWRSSASYRVRIALHLKGLEFEQRPVHLVRDGGEQHQAVYRGINPQGLVPALQHGDQLLTQSLAICEYLDELWPESPLLPAGAARRSQARAMALLVACDIHPLNNLRVQQFLKNRLDASDEQSLQWMNHWMSEGFTALEQLLARQRRAGHCAMGDTPGLVECFLVPQVYNAERFGCDLAPFPLIHSITQHCRTLPAFCLAAPENQPDAPAC
jgi:maleylacetoacetate isomerase